MKKKARNIKGAKAAVSESKQSAEGVENFPGYPLYPSSDDIMNRAERVDVDLDTAPVNMEPIKNSFLTEIEIVNNKDIGTNKTDSDLTKDDFQALASDEIRSTGDDEILANRTWPVDFAGEDLDVPGSEEDDAQEALGSEDEENNSYSIGGDRHADLEEDHS